MVTKENSLPRAYTNMSHTWPQLKGRKEKKSIEYVIMFLRQLGLGQDDDI